MAVFCILCVALLAVAATGCISTDTEFVRDKPIEAAHLAVGAQVRAEHTGHRIIIAIEQNTKV
jgi:hypothetical protein